MKKALIALLASISLITSANTCKSQTFNQTVNAAMESFSQTYESKSEVKADKPVFPQDFRSEYKIQFDGKEVGEESTLTLRRILDNPQTKAVEAYETYGKLHFEFKKGSILVTSLVKIQIDYDLTTVLDSNLNPIRNVFIARDKEPQGKYKHSEKSLEEVAESFYDYDLPNPDLLKRVVITDFENNTVQMYLEEGYCERPIGNYHDDFASGLIKLFNSALNDKADKDYEMRITFNGSDYIVPAKVRHLNGLTEFYIDMNSVPLLKNLNDATVLVTREGVPISTVAHVGGKYILETRLDNVKH